MDEIYEIVYAEDEIQLNLTKCKQPCSIVTGADGRHDCADVAEGFRIGLEVGSVRTGEKKQGTAGAEGVTVS